LRQPDDRAVLAKLCGRRLRAIALHVERGRNDLALLFRKRLDLPARATPAAATTTSALRLRLAEVLAEGPDAQEEQIARCGLRRCIRVVRRARVVGHGVARFNTELLQIEGVSGGDFR